MMDSLQAYERLAQSTFAIIRMAGGHRQFVGTAFVISEAPHVLTTFGALQPLEDKREHVRYGVTKGVYAADKESGHRKSDGLRFLFADQLYVNDVCNIVVLRIDVQSKSDVASELGLRPAVPLQLGFSEPRVGDAVVCLGMADAHTQQVQPRLLHGRIVSQSSMRFGGTEKRRFHNQTRKATSVRVFELDYMFIPGFSGAPVLNLRSGEVIGLLAVGKSWPAGLTDKETCVRVRLGPVPQPDANEMDLVMPAPVVATLSLAIQMASLEEFLRSERILSDEARPAEIDKKAETHPKSPPPRNVN